MNFLTGSTGVLGRDYLRTAVLSRPEERYRLLMRGESPAAAEERAKELFTSVFGAGSHDSLRERIEVVPGDVSLPRLGLGDGQYDHLASTTNRILHFAADTRLNVPLEDAERTNIFGASQVIDLARRANSLNPSFEGLFHLSTAYVAGDTSDTVRASDLRVQGPFRNYYEQSKAQGESLVREAGKEIPICIFRPSVVIGQSTTGRTSSFNVIYPTARLIVNGIVSVLPAIPSTPFDLIPVDFVSGSIDSLVHNPHRSSNCYHICSGVGRESSPKEIIDCLIATFNKYRARGRRTIVSPVYLAPEMVSRVYHAVCRACDHVRALERILTDHVDTVKHILPFLPYLIRNPRFDTTETTNDLPATLRTPPLFDLYAERIFKYCFDTNFGRRLNLGTEEEVYA
ncbi:MAG: SDR family oxidoreductase [Deltaproteobacteria bacterium]|nr:SDR family oxidoreductase [Deltaproteobacteria bacterium]